MASIIKADTLQSTTANVFILNSSGTEYARFDSSGNMGIGTTSPGAKLDVRGSSTFLINAANPTAWVSSDSSLTTQSMYMQVNTTSSDTRLGSYTSHPLAFLTNNTERMRITSGGELFVGTTSNFSADKLCLNFTSLQNGIGIRDDSNSSGAYYAVFRNSANTVIGSITRVTTTNAVTYNTSSDQRLKSNIADASPVLNKLMTVKVRQFDWTEGNLHQDAGFIAQELAPILSGIVTEGRTEDDLWQLDYARLTPYLVKSIQELKAIVDAQAVEIAALKAK